MSQTTLLPDDVEALDSDSLAVEILELETYELPRAETAPLCGCGPCGTGGGTGGCRPSKAMTEDPRRNARQGTRWIELT